MLPLVRTPVLCGMQFQVLMEPHMALVFLLRVVHIAATRNIPVPCDLTQMTELLF